MNETGCKALTKDECDKILGAMDGRHRLRNRALFSLGIKTGFRISEILSMRVKDVWDGAKVRGSVTVGAGWMKGKKKSRTMPINPIAANALGQYLRLTRMDHPVFSSFPLFPAQGGRESITSRQAYSIIVDAAHNAGVDTSKLGTHSMRKTFASAAWHHPAIGGDVVKMAKLLGHSNFSNTIRYIQFLDGSLDAAVLSI